jgi:predicted AAA+ superfamily ATPase
MEKLIELYRRLLLQTDTDFVRYLHETIDWNARLIGIIGARGVGKTTLLLQRIKLYLDVEKTIFVNADDIYFSENSLFDLADRFYKDGGEYLFIDEIHKYPRWSKELKMIYDYFPSLHVVFTGSSILDIYKGSDDLSRRALSYLLQGLSFREYLNMSQNLRLPVYPLEEILANKVELPVERPLPLFRKYLQSGFYPFYAEVGFWQRLQNIVNQTLETDIPTYANMTVASARKLKQLLYVVAQSVPFKPNMSKIAEIIKADRGKLNDYFYYMEKVGLILQLQSDNKGMRALQKIEKVYLNNPNLIYGLANNEADTGNVRETFFLNQMSVNHNVLAAEKTDFIIDRYVFEIGGKNKAHKQIEGLKNAFVVKDDIEFGYQNVLPLWTFGFSY